MAVSDPSAAASGGQLTTPKQPLNSESDIGLVGGTTSTGECPPRELGAVADPQSGSVLLRLEGASSDEILLNSGGRHTSP